LQEGVAMPRVRRQRPTREHPEPGDFCGWLCLGREGRREQAQGERDGAPDGAVPHGRLRESVLG
jgi:hypothetical protein